MNRRLVTNANSWADLLKYFVENTRGDKPWADADDEWVQMNTEHITGEAWERVTRSVCMEDQILRQLFLQASDQELNNLFEERESLIQDPSLKGFWSELKNSEFGREGVARMVWEDFHNNDTLTFNSFEEYWDSKKNLL
jgi:hypothetical protein